MKCVYGKPKQKQCKKCPLYRDYKEKNGVKNWFVPATFWPDQKRGIDVLFLAQSPDATEDDPELGGEPLVGDSGTFLKDGVIRPMNRGVLTGTAFDNVVKCRPTKRRGPRTYKNRDPTEKEITRCSPYSKKTIKQLKPKVVVLLGKVAAQSVFPDVTSIMRSRGEVRELDGVTYVLTYHPSFVIRSQEGTKREKYERHITSDVRRAFVLSGRLKAQAEKTINLPKNGRSIWVDKVSTVKRIVRKILSLPRGSVVSLDTEASGLNMVYGITAYSIQLCWDGVNAYVIPLNHRKTPFTAPEIREVYKWLRRLFTALRYKKNGVYHDVKRFMWLAQNAKFELHLIRRELGVEVTNNPVVDLMQVAYLQNENRVQPRSGSADKDPKEFYYPDRPRGLALDRLITIHLGAEYAPAALDKKERATIGRWPLERFIPYAGADVWKLWRLLYAILAEVEAEGYREKLLKLAVKLYAPANLVVTEMEHNGMLCDIEHMRMLQRRDVSPTIGRMLRLEELLRKKKAVRKLNKRLSATKAKGTNFLFGGEVWVFSPSKKDHLRMLFFDVLGYEPLSYTKKSERHPEGQAQVNSAFFNSVAEYDDENEPVNIAALVSDWTQLATLHNNFAAKLYKRAHPEFGHDDVAPDTRIRSSQGMSATTTGRYTAARPNQAQLPRVSKKKPARKAVKDIFIAPLGKAVYACDLMANEVRCGANCAGDEKMGHMFQTGRAARWKYRLFSSALGKKDRPIYVAYLDNEDKAKFDDNSSPLNEAARTLLALKKKGGKTLKKLLFLRLQAELLGDIHKLTASEFYDTALDKVTKELRTDTKGIVFGHMYGRSPKSIALQIKRSLEETEELLQKFDEKFPQFSNRLNTWPEEAEDNGYVESPLGRRRRFHDNIWAIADWDRDIKWIKAKARRQAKNSVIQGYAFDCCIVAAALFMQYVRQNGKAHWLFVNIVHDAIYVEAPIKDRYEVLAVMEWCMTNAAMKYMQTVFGAEFVAPLECDFNIGLSLGALHGWDFSTPHLDVVMGRVIEEHIKRWGIHPDKVPYENMPTRKNIKYGHMNRKTWMDVPDIDDYTTLLEPVTKVAA